MNFAVALSLLSFTGFGVAGCVLLVKRKQTGFGKTVLVALLLSLFLYEFIAVSNLLEHLSITSVFDTAEDLAEVLFTLVFLFFIYSWKNERSEKRFQELFMHAPIPFAEVTRQGRLVKVNHLMSSELTRVYAESAKTLPVIDEWWRRVIPDTVTFTRVFETWKCAVDRAVTTGALIPPLEVEMAYPDGTTGIKIVGGSIIGENILLTLVDISERKKAEQEKEKLQAQLLQSQKLEAIGTLAGGVAHDYNNMLGAIIGYADLTLEMPTLADEVRNNITKIMDAAQRSSKLTRQLLIFARKKSTVMEVIDLDTAVTSMTSMLLRLIGENITLTWQLYSGAEKCLVRMDPAHLDQILVNLCVNARDAIAGVGKITIKTEIITFDERSSRIWVDAAPGTYVRLSVADNGCGMDSATKARIFEPFFTTKGVGKGTGLGLSTVYGIVRQYGGFINCYSELHVGTTFNIFIPFQYSGIPVKAATEVTVTSGNGETILLVEDDPILMEMTQQMLLLLNYKVLPAATPQKAIDIMEKSSSDIDLVVSDVIMPEMNGHELMERLKKIRSNVPCLYMSGYTADIVGILQEDILFIQKPFSRRELAHKIRQALVS